MDTLDDNFMKTLPYFLSHGTRPYELCFVFHHEELKCVIYIDNDDHFIQTIPHELWDAKVINQYYDGLLVYEGDGNGALKCLRVVNVHYVEIER